MTTCFLQMTWRYYEKKHQTSLIEIVCFMLCFLSVYDVVLNYNKKVRTDVERSNKYRTFPNRYFLPNHDGFPRLNFCLGTLTSEHQIEVDPLRE